MTNRDVRHPSPIGRGPQRRAARGVTLIELMIALVLGLVVSAAAGGVFLANKRVYGATETLNRIQENTRVSFEIMSRDVREAGGNPCGADSKFVNLLNSKDGAWWAAFEQGLRGYEGAEGTPGTAFGSAAAQRVAGTDAVDLHLTNDGDYSVVKHDTPAATLDLNNRDGLEDNEIVMACNTSYSLVFQITDFNGNGLLHNGGNGTPGNCGSEFQFADPAKCAGASNPNGYCMMGGTSSQCVDKSDDPAQVVRVYTMRWYIGNNGRGSRSLYRARVVNKSLTEIPDIIDPVEIAEGVSDLQLSYRSFGSSTYQIATGVADWSRVNAVRIDLLAEGVDGALTGSYIEGTDGEVLSRGLTHIVAVRNREGVL